MSFWDIDSQRQIKSLPLSSSFTSCAFSSDGVSFAITGQSCTRVYDLRRADEPIWEGKGGLGVVWDWKVKRRMSSSSTKDAVSVKTKASTLTENTPKSLQVGEVGTVKAGSER